MSLFSFRKHEFAPEFVPQVGCRREKFTTAIPCSNGGASAKEYSEPIPQVGPIANEVIEVLICLWIISSLVIRNRYRL